MVHLIQYYLLTVVCLSLPPPTNGVISYSDSTLGLNTVATYTCATGYTLTRGTTRVCVTGGNWTGSPPTCQGELFVVFAVHVYACEVNIIIVEDTIPYTVNTEPTESPTTCLDLTVQANGMISYNIETASLKPVGTVATYTCDTGYAVTLTGGTTRTCVNGGVWSGSVPTCQRKWNICTVH